MNTTLIVIYNIIGFIGSGSILLSTMVSKKDSIMKVQTGGTAFLLAADLMAKGYSGAVQDLIAIIRNITVIKEIHKKWLNAFFIISGLVLGVVCNNRGLIGFLPIFANFQFSCLVLRKNADEVMIKCSVCVSNVCWAIFNFYLMNYANAAVNAAICVSGIVFVLREIIKRRGQTKDSEEKESTEA